MAASKAAATLVMYWGQLARENERLDEIAARLEALDAELLGRTTMTITQYREVAAIKQAATAGQQAAGRVVHIISTTRYPGRTFAVVEDTVTESAQALEAILGRLRNVFMARQIVRVEASEYSLGDLVLRLGTAVVASGARRGVLLEIEYRPVAALGQASAILLEAVQLALPPGIIVQTEQIEMPAKAIEQFALGASFTARHVIVQYLALLRADGIL